MFPQLPWLDTVILANPLRLWVVAAVIAGAAIFVLETAKAILVHRLAARATRAQRRSEDPALAVLRSLRALTVVVIALSFATRILVLPGQAVASMRALLTLTMAYQAIVTANVAIDHWLVARFARGGLPESSGGGHGIVRFSARAVVWAAILLVALDNLGVEITTLIAGLGVGGIAVALAVQKILGDVFCSLSILLDKPFELGDFIVVGDLAGTVEHVGVKTTRIRSLGGEQLVFANSDLVGSRVRNYKRMRERRVSFEFGVTYQTTPEQAAEIPGLIRSIVERLDGTRFDRAHFKALGDSALVFEVVYFVLAPDYNAYMDTQQEINLSILRAFAERDVAFAYPTRTLHVEQAAEPRAAA